MSITLEKERGEMSGRKAISDAVKKALITILQELYCRGFLIIPRIFLVIKEGVLVLLVPSCPSKQVENQSH